MKTIFSTASVHHITEANINYYATPFVHPTRTMNEHDFIYLLQGEWQFGQNDEIYTLKKDTLLILSAGNRHYGLSPCTAGTKTMYFHAAREAGDVSAADMAAPAVAACIDASTNKSIKNYVSHIVNNKLSGNQRKADLYFELLLCELAETAHDPADYAIAERIEKIILSNPERFFLNKELADSARVSLKTAETKFKQKFGVTIHQYSLNYKINEAISYFETFPHISVKEVALNLGFYDEYHFSKQFKKVTGTCPSAYRKRFNKQ